MRKPGRRKPSVPKPSLTVEQILAWADDFHVRNNCWPNSRRRRGLRPGEREVGQHQPVSRPGLRGLPGGDTLARLLQRERGARYQRTLPPLTEDGVVCWAEAHHRRTGQWPTQYSGSVAEAPGEVWCNVNACLQFGFRGLPGGDTLARLLALRLGLRTCRAPRLTERQILSWADDHKRRTGKRPSCRSGPVLAAPGETWKLLDDYLRAGRRGLAGGSSLAQLLAGRAGG